MKARTNTSRRKGSPSRKEKLAKARKKNIQLQKTRGVGNREAISTLLDEFDERSRQHGFVQLLAVGVNDPVGHDPWDVRYTEWQRVRGDGNCYYRAVLFSALSPSNPGNEEVFDRLLNVTESEFKAIRTNERTASRQEMLMWAVDVENRGRRYNKQIDLALVRAARALTRRWLMQHADDPSYKIAVQSQGKGGGYASVEAYCDATVSKMGEFTKSELEQAALPPALGIQVCIVGLATELFSRTYPENDAPADVHVLFRPGHYDVLYPSVTPDTSSDEELARALQISADESREVQLQETAVAAS